MQYEDFIYELIKLLMSWGTWKDSVKILYGNKVYSPCRMPESTSKKYFDFEDFVRRKTVFEAEKEKSMFRDIKNVLISEATEKDLEFRERWPEKCEMSIELNSPLCDLFGYGVLTVDLSDLPLDRKIKAYEEHEELQEKFHEEYDEEEIQIDPEEYGIPSELEFDSADEYKEFLEGELNKAENDFITNLTGKITYDNDLEAEICELCIDYGLSYSGGDAYLFIGHDYF